MRPTLKTSRIKLQTFACSGATLPDDLARFFPDFSGTNSFRPHKSSTGSLIIKKSVASFSLLSPLKLSSSYPMCSNSSRRFAQVEYS